MQADLERQIDRALKQLPGIRAPHTLLPRVMAAVQAWAARPWYERAWFTWPRWLQAASASAVTLVFVAIWAAMPFVSDVADRAYFALVSSLGGGVASSVERIDATVTGAHLLWRALVEPILAYAAIVVIAMYLACATVAVALGRVLFGKAMPS
jgi:hypothetical protein